MIFVLLSNYAIQPEYTVQIQKTAAILVENRVVF